MKATQCRGCGARIVWIRTRAGKVMPCDARPVAYQADEFGADMVVTPDGRVVRGRIVTGDGSGALGYMSHFATCPMGPAFRRGR